MPGMNSGIYLITCTPHGKLPRYYVGQSVDVGRRFREHIRTLSNGSHTNRRLLRSWRMYGCDCFSFDVLELIDRHLLDEAELWWLSQMVGSARCMNILASPAGGALSGPMHYAFGSTLSADHRARISSGNKGKTRGADTRMAISRATSGEANPMFGRRGHASSRSKAVVATCISDGSTRLYESACLAVADGFYQESISRCCNGVQKSHLGFNWSFATQIESF